MQFKNFLLIPVCVLYMGSLAARTSTDTSEPSVLEIDDPAPLFQGLDEEGNSWKSEDIMGKKYLVVYFYPAAMTGGCTRQACAYRDDRDRLAELNIAVVGISGDKPAGLAIFKNAHQLNFPLLSDPEGQIARKFGMPAGNGGQIETTVDGKKVILSRGVTTQRWTFIIGLNGRIVYKNTNVDAVNDSETIVHFIKSLSDPSIDE